MTHPRVEGTVRAGRRRDPEIGPRVLEAALRLYARDGWGGFSFDAVAREAAVGKPAIYRRWSCREDLLVEAIASLSLPIARDLGSLRDDLLDYAYQWVEWYSDQDHGLAVLRLHADMLNNPRLAESRERLIAWPRTQAARSITRRAIERGEVLSSLNSATIVELLVGGMQNHWMHTPPSSLRRMRTTFRQHAENLVTIILNGVDAMRLDPHEEQQL